MATFSAKGLEGRHCRHPFLDRQSLIVLADYVTLPVAWSDKYEFPENDHLRKKFIEKTGNGPDLVAGNAYASGQVLFAAIEKAGTLDRKAIRDTVRNTNMMTVSGPVKFNPDCD